MKKLFYYVLVLLHAEANAGVFPKNVENECSYSWTLKDSSGPPAFRKGNDTVNANISLLAELRDTKNSLQEKAYIYISCSGEAPEINVAPYFEYSKFKTLCFGIRMTGLDRKTLNSSFIFEMPPRNLKVISKPNDPTLKLQWEEGIFFEIVNNSFFTWTLTSKLSGKTHRGTVPCK